MLAIAVSGSIVGMTVGGKVGSGVNVATGASLNISSALATGADLIKLGGTESVEVVNWLAMRGALPAEVRTVVEAYYPHKIMGYGLQAFSVAACWPPDCDGPWLLVSDRDDGPRLFRRSTKRTWTEELFRDEKSSGFRWGESHVDDPVHAARLTLLLALATNLPQAADGRFWSDGATYHAMAGSLAFDRDLVFGAEDLARVRSVYAGGPQAIVVEVDHGGLRPPAIGALPYQQPPHGVGSAEARCRYALSSGKRSSPACHGPAGYVWRPCSSISLWSLEKRRPALSSADPYSAAVRWSRRHRK